MSDEPRDETAFSLDVSGNPVSSTSTLAAAHEAMAKLGAGDITEREFNTLAETDFSEMIPEQVTGVASDPSVPESVATDTPDGHVDDHA
jgi:hypothetical protein